MGEGDPMVSIYPNPSNGTFALNVSGYAGNQFTVQVTNATGQVVYANQISVDSESYVLDINLNNAAAGVYQVSLTNDAYQLHYPAVITK
jgi:hypothetical protein